MHEIGSLWVYLDTEMYKWIFQWFMETREGNPLNQDFQKTRAQWPQKPGCPPITFSLML